MDNASVPFTPAHAAAALPFRRMRFIPSALVVGTLAPDFEYFLRLAPSGGFGHTLLGALLLTLPLALIFLWLFHRYVKRPLASVLPESVDRRLAPYLGRFQFFGLSRFALIVISILVGIATHLIWDSFTHQTMWLYHHWSFLRRSSHVPFLGPTQNCTLLQHGSTIVGIGLLTVWCSRWYRSAPVNDRQFGQLSRGRKIAAIIMVSTTAVIVGLARAVADAGMPGSRHSLEIFAGEAVVTASALVWWQLVLFGLLFGRIISSSPQTHSRI
jgi:membrane-bound metal-dependent hydrolase YbcI (DUF457 family)